MMTTTATRRWLAALACAAALGAAACGGQDDPPPAPRAVENPVDPATAGAVSGTVRLSGPPPAAEPIDMASDPYCERQGQAVTQTHLVGPDGGLQHVFVYVTDGLGNLVFPVPAEAKVLDQQNCRYVPRVLGIQVGQTLEIRSSDDTLHNVHAEAEQNREFNKAHQGSGVRHTHVFSTREVMVPFKCDVHRWMRAWVGVLDHPFHAVTGADGRFTLSGLPPGTYTIEAWHEQLGTRTQTVTIGAQETGTADFTFER